MFVQVITIFLYHLDFIFILLAFVLWTHQVIGFCQQRVCKSSFLASYLVILLFKIKCSLHPRSSIFGIISLQNSIMVFSLAMRDGVLKLGNLLSSHNKDNQSQEMIKWTKYKV